MDKVAPKDARLAAKRNTRFSGWGYPHPENKMDLIFSVIARNTCDEAMTE